MEDNFYLDFENNFRGSPDQICKITSNYDGLISHINNIEDKPTLLDIGCGRGEWLKKCSNLGFKTLGFELNPKMASMCQEMGLNVKEGDALSLLKELPDNSFSLITVFHVIEHISFENINLLLSECYRILNNQGLIILETPSIDNLSVSSRLFHIDPTHVNPINPDLLLFSMERIGFDMVKYFFINGGPLQSDDHDSLTRILNGVAQDLMIIGTRSETSTRLLKENNRWRYHLNQGLSTIEACVQFDHRLRIKSLMQDQSINYLRDRVYTLEAKINKINTSPFLFIGNIFRKIFKYIISKFINQKTKLNILILNICRFLIRIIYKYLSKALIGNTKIFYLIFRFLDKLASKFGYRLRQNKLLKESLKLKEDRDLVFRNEQQLDLHYSLSSSSKSIYDQINE